MAKCEGKSYRAGIMKTSAGMWIDHQEAIIVLHSDMGHETTKRKSQAQTPVRRCDERDQEPVVTQEVPRDDSRKRRDQGGPASYYDTIISHIRRADEILIFGPDEAKCELKARIEKAKGLPRILTLEFGDKMAESRIVARVRQHFEHPAPRVMTNRPEFPTLNQIKNMRTVF